MPFWLERGKTKIESTQHYFLNPGGEKKKNKKQTTHESMLNNKAQ